MESLLDSLTAFLGGVFDLARGGFDGVNQVTGLLIAIIAALLMAGWKRLWATALIAALAHVAVGVVRPVLDGGAFQLPDLLTAGFWMAFLALFMGYAIVIAVFFLIRSLVTGGLPGGHRKHAH